MTRAERKKLRGRELAVWAGVFAAEWFDHAEAALTIADGAVERMRRWERENGPISDKVDREMRASAERKLAVLRDETAQLCDLLVSGDMGSIENSIRRAHEMQRGVLKESGKRKT